MRPLLLTAPKLQMGKLSPIKVGRLINALITKIFKAWSRELLGYPQGQNYFHRDTKKLIYLPFSIFFLHKVIYNQLNEEADMRIHPRTQVRNLIFLSAILHIKLIPNPTDLTIPNSLCSCPSHSLFL